VARGPPGARLDDAAIADKAARILDPLFGAEMRATWTEAAAGVLTGGAQAWNRLKMLF
jgi:hypothetical protein